MKDVATPTSRSFEYEVRSTMGRRSTILARFLMLTALPLLAVSPALTGVLVLHDHGDGLHAHRLARGMFDENRRAAITMAHRHHDGEQHRSSCAGHGDIDADAAHDHKNQHHDRGHGHEHGFDCDHAAEYDAHDMTSASASVSSSPSMSCSCSCACACSHTEPGRDGDDDSCIVIHVPEIDAAPSPFSSISPNVETASTAFVASADLVSEPAVDRDTAANRAPPRNGVRRILTMNHALLI